MQYKPVMSDVRDILLINIYIYVYISYVTFEKASPISTYLVLIIGPFQSIPEKDRINWKSSSHVGCHFHFSLIFGR
jgi:hypothetical protein